MNLRFGLILVLGISLPGCFKDFHVDAGIRDRSPEVAESDVRSAPVLPDQVQSGNAYQMAEALWDEIDRESTKVPPSTSTQKK